MFQLEWKYLQRTVPGLPRDFRGGGVDANFQTILVNRVKRGKLGITYPWLSVDSPHSTSNAACGELRGSLLGGTNLNYVRHRACVCRANADRVAGLSGDMEGVGGST